MATFNWITSENKLDKRKKERVESLSDMCEKSIVSGFSVDKELKTFHFSYDLDNQQNFTDTMRLFENDMIDSVGWNAYVNDKKVRLRLNKEEFEVIYLAGVKHKVDCLITLNEYLIPMVESARAIEDVEKVVWNDRLISEEFSTDATNTLDKKAKKAEQTGKRNTSGILELTNLILSGGM